jgi:hypothetical protein
LYKFGDQELCEICLAESVFDEDLVASNAPEARVTAFDLSVLTESTWRFMPFKTLTYAIVLLCTQYERNDSVDYGLLIRLTKKSSESMTHAEERLREYIDLFKGSIVDGVIEENGEKRLKLSNRMQRIIEEYRDGRDEYAIGILDTIIDNRVVGSDIVNSLVRKSFIEAIYSKISPDGTIRLEPVTEVDSYQCKLCNMVFRAAEYDLLIGHLRNAHMVHPDQFKENYSAITKIIGYKVSDEEFRSAAEKYGVLERTRIDRFTKALKYGALFNQDTMRTNENGQVEWIVKPEIVRYLKRVRELTLERIRTLERVV